MSVSLFYIPCDNSNTAKIIAKKLLEKKLIACANIIPHIHSIYSLNNEIVEDHEVILILKTKSSICDKCREIISKLHPYDIPSIISIDDVKTNYSFENWINSNLD